MQVFTRLHKLQLCITHSPLLMVVDDAAEGHDELVVDWQDMQELSSQRFDWNDI